MYSTKNYLRSFEVILTINLFGIPRRFTIFTKYMFDASAINFVLDQSASSEVPVIETLNALIPLVDMGSFSHDILNDLVLTVSDSSYISSYIIKTFKIK